MRNRLPNSDDRERRESRARFSLFKSSQSEFYNIASLEQKLSQRKNMKLVKDCAKKLALELKGFKTDKDLELYYDMYKSGKELCYIYKGWKDSGFRIGDWLIMNKSSSNFKDNFYEVFRICSKNLISMCITGQEDNNITLCFEVGIYRDGFNEKVLREAIKTFEDAMNKVKLLLG